MVLGIVGWRCECSVLDICVAGRNGWVASETVLIVALLWIQEHGPVLVGFIMFTRWNKEGSLGTSLLSITGLRIAKKNYTSRCGKDGIHYEKWGSFHV